MKYLLSALMSFSSLSYAFQFECNLAVMTRDIVQNQSVVRQTNVYTKQESNISYARWTADLGNGYELDISLRFDLTESETFAGQDVLFSGYTLRKKLPSGLWAVYAQQSDSTDRTDESHERVNVIPPQDRRSRVPTVYAVQTLVWNLEIATIAANHPEINPVSADLAGDLFKARLIDTKVVSNVVANCSAK